MIAVQMTPHEVRMLLRTWPPPALRGRLEEALRTVCTLHTAQGPIEVSADLAELATKLDESEPIEPTLRIAGPVDGSAWLIGRAWVWRLLDGVTGEPDRDATAGVEAIVAGPHRPVVTTSAHETADGWSVLARATDASAWFYENRVSAIESSIGDETELKLCPMTLRDDLGRARKACQSWALVWVRQGRVVAALAARKTPRAADILSPEEVPDADR